MIQPESNYHAVVIGAGPAGTAAATFLHRAGHRVCVLEKTRFPRFVIGESLLPRCNDLLREVGLLQDVERQGYLEKHGAVFLRGAESCRFEFADQHTQGAQFTWQVPRDHFDQVLAQAAMKQGVPYFFEQTVTGVQTGPEAHVLVRGPTGATRQVDCRFVVDASGYGRVLSRLLGLDQPSDLPVRHSLFAHVTGDHRPAGRDEGLIWIVQCEGGAWSWVIPFSNGRTSIGVVGTPEFFSNLPAPADDPAAPLRAVIGRDPNLSRRLGDAEFVFEPRSIAGYSIGIEKLYGHGFCLVGNAAEFLDPVFSSGVTLALESALLAARVVSRELNGETVDWAADFEAPLHARIDCFRTYVNAWYAGDLSRLFFSAHPPANYRKMLCSVLAGNAWDQSNPLVREHRRKLRQLVQMC